MFDAQISMAASAYKHGVSGDDIAHAVRMQIVAVRQVTDRLLLIGPAVDGSLLEIVQVDATDQTPALVIHAMKVRRKFYQFL
ncbi:MAG: hypothetical protein M3Y42_12935 [Actinomycetota bacterium]|nr:hypothetical protein [Actinomycetota bacterium]MDQ2957858.1 hypothetical protein [Actinomycetota bacterium]